MTFSPNLCRKFSRAVHSNAFQCRPVHSAASATPQVRGSPHHRDLATASRAGASKQCNILQTPYVGNFNLFSAALGPKGAPQRQLRHRGVATAASSDTQAEALDYGPTVVPRAEGVRDGIWKQVDQALVDATVVDAKLTAKPESADKGGYVLLGKSVEELQELAVEYGQPKFRGKQIYDGLYNGATAVNDIVQLPKVFRDAMIVGGVKTGRSNLHQTVKSSDGTRKYLCQLHDGRVVETVGIPMDRKNKDSLTACISSQVGCPMRCTFCATGKGGFARNLMAHEIVDQVLTVQNEFGKRVDNVVFMGMGEPLLNIQSVVQAFKILNKDMGIGARSITISTVGVKGAIPELAKHGLQCVLAVSIHAPTQVLRSQLVPSARAYPIDALMRDCQHYFQVTSRRVSFEYTLLNGQNDSPDQAQQLASLLRSYNLASHVNLIPWNPVDESEFKRPSSRNVSQFVKVLENNKITASVRVTRGLDAAAACGQLRNNYQKEKLPEFAALG